MPAEEERSAAPSRAYSAYVLGLLFVVYVFNFVDRQVLAILIGPIQQELGVSDTAMGLLAGPAFALFYTAAGVPIARWADRGSRRNVIALSLLVWSGMTALCGFARSYAHLALARIGVGIGEAGGTPPSHSLISDYFPPERRATALALYGNGIYVGAGLGIMAGGLLLEFFGDWRQAFVAVGLAGIPLALLVRLSVREAPRGSREGAPGGSDASFAEVLRHLRAQPAFGGLVAGACCQSLFGYALLTWGAVYLGRVFEMPWSEVARWFGPTVMFGGCVGVSLGGWLADRLGARDPRWYLRLPALGAAGMLPFMSGFLGFGDARAALLCFVPAYTIANLYVGPLWSTLQGLARPEMRATASAILLLILNVVGLGLGPFLVGGLNDLFAAQYGDTAIRQSLLIVTGISGLAAPLFWNASEGLRDGIAPRDPASPTEATAR